MFFWFDLIIILMILLYTFDGYRQGLIKTIIDIFGVALSLFIAIKYYSVAGTFFVSWGLDKNLAKPIGFFALWFLVQLLAYLVTTLIFHYVPGLMQNNRTVRALGVIPGFLKGIMISAIFLIILMTLPFSTNFKERLSKSFISGTMVRSSATTEAQMAGIFGQMNNNLTLYNIAPKNDEEGVTQLNFKTNNFTPSATDETSMLEILNQDRVKTGLKPLSPDILLRNVARAHAADMLRTGFFAHTGPAGQTPFDRLAAANVSFNVAGENLALAPSMELGHVGLMNSPSHRENILDYNYTRIGIGILDAGPYGKMIVQEFAG
ncbi:MAG: hypothetical protein HW405_712 [Candidatus Berkelbacteria bacterium]|nr:hypothetical protein [Candidatus Berkelbacteria bacterium]